VVDTLSSKQRVQFFMHSDFGSLPADRWSAATAALTTLMGTSLQEVAIYRAYQGNKIFDLGVPARSVERLRSLLQSNNGQLRLLRVKKVKLEKTTGEIEEWAIKDGRFYLESLPKPE